MNKTDLIQKVKALEGLTQDERAYLINLVNTKKKYGLVWEDKPEEVEDQLRENLPVLREVVEKRIIGGHPYNPNNPSHPSADNNHPNHILIEGDNLHALTALTFTHEGKIDVIYIDPPYNTGNKDFVYHDAFKDEPEFIDKDHPFRHSTWLSFMSKRLVIAKRLLKDDGVIFISIDDNEIAQLKLLCEDIFTATNFIAELPTIMNLKGNQDQFAFAGTHEYTIVFAKNKSKFNPSSFNFDADELVEWDEDEIGLFKKGAPMRATGSEAHREDRPLMFYPIIIDSNNNAFTISKKEHSYIYDSKKKVFDDNHLSDLINKYSDLGYEVVLPMVDENQYGRWRWGYNDNMIQRLSYDVIVTRTKQGISLYKKQRPELGDIPTKKPKSIFYKPEYSSGNGTSQLKDIFSDKRFNNPKPLDLIKDFLVIGSKTETLILDFFAGSGTTLHATMALNAEDGGNRQCILVTNNENNICEEVTYERNKRVIQGYTNAKGMEVEGLTNNNLRYYKSEFVSREPSLKNKRQLTQLATELLCIKEDCYTEQKIHIKQARLFDNSKVALLILFDDHIIPQAVEFIKGLEAPEIKVYVFSIGSDPYTEDFAEVLDKVTLCALPDAIYKAYQHVLPKKNRVVPIIEEEPEAPTNENGEQLSIL